MNKRILITGSSGFIGSYLVEEALNSGYEVVAGVRKSSDRRYLKDSRISFLEMDFSDKNQLVEALEPFKGNRFDYIIHNAGLTKANHNDEYFKTNYEYTKNFVNVLIGTRAIPQKFIYISSLAAFGPGKKTGEPIEPDDSPNPITAYGKSKLESEFFLKQTKVFPYLIIRPTAVYGPREKDLFTMIQIISKRIEPYIGSQKQLLSFVHVKDLTKAVLLAAESDIQRKEYFISDGNVYSNWQFGEIIRCLLNIKTLKIKIPISIIHALAWTLENTSGRWGKTPVINMERAKEFEANNWSCNGNVAMNDLHFTPQYDLFNGMAETIDWYKSNKWL